MELPCHSFKHKLLKTSNIFQVILKTFFEDRLHVNMVGVLVIHSISTTKLLLLLTFTIQNTENMPTFLVLVF